MPWDVAPAGPGGFGRLPSTLARQDQRVARTRSGRPLVAILRLPQRQPLWYGPDACPVLRNPAGNERLIEAVGDWISGAPVRNGSSSLLVTLARTNLIVASMDARMPVRWLLLTLLCVALIAAGQLLFKSAAGQWRIDGWSWATLRSFLAPTLMLALTVYGMTTVPWVLILRALPLTGAFPFYSLVFLLVPVLAHFVLGEPLSWNAMVGGAVIVLGVAVAVR